MSNPNDPLNLRPQLGLVTEEDLANTLGLNSVDTLATWRSKRAGPPYVKLGKKVFYLLGDVREWVVGTAQAQVAIANERHAAEQMKEAA